MNIKIKNSTVTIYEREDRVEKAKSDLLTKLYHSREKETMGGREMWLELLDMYFRLDFEGMREVIAAFTGKGGATRAACLRCLDVIIAEG